jgi:hypothetical protein
MKHFFTFFILAVFTLTTYSQTRQQFDQKVDSMLAINRQNNYHLDTLWVLDSSRTFQGYYDSLIYERTYKVLKRNDQGNPIASLDWVDENFSGFTTNSVYDSIVYFDGVQVKKQFSNAWNSVDQIWIDNSYQEYEEPGLPKVKANKGFYNNTQEYFYGYRERYVNNNGRPDTLIYETYVPETNTWKLKAKTVFYYDGQQNDTLQRFYKWTGDSWEDSARLHRHFDLNLLTLQLGELYNTSNSTWQNYVRRTYSYTNSGKIDISMFQVWSTQLNVWQDNFKYDFSYDSEDRITNRLVLHFDQNSQQLLNYQNDIYTYAEGREEIVYQSWSMPNGPWFNQFRYTTSYLADNVVDTVTNDQWDNNLQVWKPKDRLFNKYDHHYNVLESEYWYFYSWDNKWQLETKTDYYWSPFIPNATHEIQANTLAVYPNPATTQVSFVVPDNHANTGQQALLTIFDLSGRQMTQLPLQNGKAVWDCAGVKAGLYVYSLSGSGAWVSGKVVVR